MLSHFKYNHIGRLKVKKDGRGYVMQTLIKRKQVAILKSDKVNFSKENYQRQRRTLHNDLKSVNLQERHGNPERVCTNQWSCKIREAKCQ